MLQFAEEALDQVAAAVECWVDGALEASARGGRDVRPGSSLSDEIDNGIAVVSSVGDHIRSGGELQEQIGDGTPVMGLTSRQGQADRKTVLVDHGMDLGAQSSTRAADGVILAPFLPPAACWCARTMDESTSWREAGDLAAKASKTVSHTPFLAQRLKRL